MKKYPRDLYYSSFVFGTFEVFAVCNISGIKSQAIKKIQIQRIHNYVGKHSIPYK